MLAGRGAAAAAAAAALLLVCWISHSPAVLAASPKHACPYSDRLCALRPRFIFAGTVMGDWAYFHGGLDANDGATVYAGTALEVVRLSDLSTWVLQLAPNASLATTRYRHLMGSWRGELLAVGGQQDNANMESVRVLNAISLDMATRRWDLRKEFAVVAEGEDPPDFLFVWMGVYGDTMAIIFDMYASANGGDDGRYLRCYDLVTGDAITPSAGVFQLLMGADALVLYPLSAAALLTAPAPEAGQRYLTLTARRWLPRGQGEDFIPYVLEPNSEAQDFWPPASAYAFTLPAGWNLTGAGDNAGEALSMTLLELEGQPHLVWWFRTSATFKGAPPLPANGLAVYSLSIADGALSPETGRRVDLRLRWLFLSLPGGAPLAALRSLRLPKHGPVSVPAGALGSVVLPMPSVGQVHAVKDLDNMNVVSLAASPAGVVARGVSKPDSSYCAPGTWQPFILNFNLTGTPSVTGVSNYTWCPLQQSGGYGAGAPLAAPEGEPPMALLSRVLAENQALQSNRQTISLTGPAGPALVSFSPVVDPRTPIFPQYLTDEPLQGARVDVQANSIVPFTIAAGKGYPFPVMVADCVTLLGDTPVYVEHGGLNTAQTEVFSTVSAMPLAWGEGGDGLAIAPAAVAAGAKAPPARAMAAMACAPGGLAFSFGGLIYDPDPAVGLVASDTLTELSVTRNAGSGGSGFRVAARTLGGGAAQRPPPRQAHALAYLPPGLVGGGGGGDDGALLLFGGWNETLDFNLDSLPSEVTGDAARTTANVFDDTWLWDVRAERWQRLRTSGEAPPPMMWHKMAVHGKQVLVFGGRSYRIVSDGPLNVTSQWYAPREAWVLDFSPAGPPRWRSVPLTGLPETEPLLTAFPNAGVAVVPELHAMALTQRGDLRLAPLPQSVQLTEAAATAPGAWSNLMGNLTTGDWVRLAPASGSALKLSQPLLVAGDVIVSGAGSADGAPLRVDCTGADGALMVWSQGASVEDLVVSGCRGNSSAVVISPDPTGALNGSPVRLHNVTFQGNVLLPPAPTPASAPRQPQGVAAAAAAPRRLSEKVVVARMLEPPPVGPAPQQGAALTILPGAVVDMAGVIISGNNASSWPGAAVVVGARANVTMRDCVLRGNAGGALWFAGDRLEVDGCTFADNSNAGNGAAIVLRLPEPAAGDAGGGALGAVAVASIRRSRLRGNRAAARGGAVWVGPGMALEVTASNFTANFAVDGGAVYVEPGGCLPSVAGARFDGNAARGGPSVPSEPISAGSGGALVVMAAACPLDLTGCTFAGNNASADGGAVFVSQMSNTRVSCHGSLFERNAAATGSAGAVFLGTWSGGALLNRTRFLDNTAGAAGGAVRLLGINSRLEVVGCVATGNRVAARTAANQGGAIAVAGTDAGLIVRGSNLTGNAAYQGGAISHTSSQGALLISEQTLLEGNYARQSGGAVHVGRTIRARVVHTRFERNRAPGVGGALACDACGVLAVDACVFESNRGTYGGALALLDPQAATVVQRTRFLGNNATLAPAQPRPAQPSGRAGGAANATDATCDTPGCRRRRLLQLQPQPQPQPQGAPAAAPSNGALAAREGGTAPGPKSAGVLDPGVLAAVLLEPAGVDAAPHDSAYQGGGGIYAELQRTELRVAGSAFDGNHGLNGGGIVARTEACQLPSCMAIDAASLDAFTGNSAVGGSGSALLVTDLTTARFACGAGQLAPISEQLDSSCMTALRAANPDATSSPGLASVGEAIELCRLPAGDPLGSCAPVGPSITLVVAPGQGFNASALVLDGFGQPMAGGVSDANLILALRLAEGGAAPSAGGGGGGGDCTVPPVPVLFGNTTQASNGTGFFSAVTLFAAPGLYELEVVAPERPTLRRARVDVRLRNCSAGEYHAASGSCNIASTCVVCAAPFYSFDPSQPCVACGTDARAFCDGPTKLPLTGFWQSSARSDQIHQCLWPTACARSASTQAAMIAWTRTHAWIPQPDLDDAAYMGLMCAPAYQSVLCGSCRPGFGRRGSSCVQCMSKAGNTLLYVLMCAYLFTLVAVAGFLHVQQVQQRKRLALLAASRQRQVANLSRRPQPPQEFIPDEPDQDCSDAISTFTMIRAGPPYALYPVTSDAGGTAYATSVWSLPPSSGATPLTSLPPSTAPPSSVETRTTASGATTPLTSAAPSGAEPALPSSALPSSALPSAALPSAAGSLPTPPPALLAPASTGGALSEQLTAPPPSSAGGALSEQLTAPPPASTGGALSEQRAAPAPSSTSSLPTAASALSQQATTPSSAGTLSSSMPSSDLSEEPSAPASTTAPSSTPGRAGGLTAPLRSSGPGARGSRAAAHQVTPVWALWGTPTVAEHTPSIDSRAPRPPSTAAQPAPTAAAQGGADADAAAVDRPGNAVERSWAQRLFAVEPFEQLDALAILNSPANPAAAAAAPAANGAVANGKAPLPLATSAKGTVRPAGGAAPPLVRLYRRFWVSDLLKLLVSHLQMLGVLRNLKLSWPSVVQTMLIYFDQTQTVTTWVSIDCSLQQDASVPVSIQRLLVQMLFPLGALAAGVVAWLCYVALRRARRRPLPRLRTYLPPRLVLTAVLVLFYLYPTVSNAVASVFSCVPADRPADADCPPGGGYCPAAAALQANATYWTQDTSQTCFAGAHAVLAYALGIPMLVLFCAGFPLALAARLRRLAAAGQLGDADVDLQYGFLYDSYRRRHYYWECVVLLEKLALVLAVTLLQRVSSAAQVLAALGVIWVAAILQAACRPFNCALLDSMQRASLYVLQATLFLVMMAAIAEPSASTATITAAVVIIAVINMALVLAFMVAIGVEGHRALAAANERGGVTWRDVGALLRGLCCCGRRRRRALPVVAPAGGGGAGGGGGGGVGGADKATPGKGAAGGGEKGGAGADAQARGDRDAGGGKVDVPGEASIMAMH